MCLDNNNVRICGVYMRVGQLHDLKSPYKSIYIYSCFDWKSVHYGKTYFG